MDINKYMTPRLLTVASFAEKNSVVADVGTDHAYIPIWLIKNEIAKSAIAMDINEGPIFRAQENIKKFSLEEKIKTRLSDGLCALLPGEADTVIIAGMGGILINEILRSAKRLYPHIKRYILQPMTAVEETRKFLSENGFSIQDECLAKEDNKIYCVILAVPGEMKIEKEIDYYIGKKLIENKDNYLLDYINGKLYEYEKAIDSLILADREKFGDRLSHFQYLKEEMEKIKKECLSW